MVLLVEAEELDLKVDKVATPLVQLLHLNHFLILLIREQKS